MCQECSNLEAVTVDEEPESGTSGQRWVATVIARTGLSSQGDQPKSHLVLHFKTVRAIKKGEAFDWFPGGTLFRGSCWLAEGIAPEHTGA